MLVMLVVFRGLKWCLLILSRSFSIVGFLYNYGDQPTKFYVIEKVAWSSRASELGSHRKRANLPDFQETAASSEAE